MQVLSDAEFASLIHKAQPTFEEVSQYYSAHLSDYDEVQIRRLFIWKQRDNAKGAPVLSSQAAKTGADQIHKEYAAGTSPQKQADDPRKVRRWHVGSRSAQLSARRAVGTNREGSVRTQGG